MQSPSFNDQRVLVIGSNSFSATHFVDHLLDKNAQVWCISRSEEQDAVFNPYKLNKNFSKVKFFPLDLNKNLDEITALIGDFQPEYVVNFAAQGMVAQSWQHPEHWFNTNVVSNVLLHDRLRKFRFLKKYVHVSTPEVYGNCSGMITENAPYNPSTPYAVSRASCDMSLFSFLNHYQFPVVFTRSANVFGWGQQLYRIIPKTILSILTGNKLPLDGGGKSIRSFIHIKDVAEGTTRAMLYAKPGSIYHFATERNIAIADVVKLICQQLNVDFEKSVTLAPERPGKDHAYILDATKARQELNWTPEISLEAGIAETVQWIQTNLEDLKTRPANYIHKV